MSLDLTHHSRHVELEGCFNLRDLGGYPTTTGDRVRWRRLFRSDSLHRLTAADRVVLARLGIATVIDLRTDDEVRDRGAFSGAVTYRHLPLVDALRPSDDTAVTYVDAALVTARYLEILDGASEQITEILALLTDPAAFPAVFHCAAGRDRTGVVAAVILGLLGVPDDEIVGDYVLSRHGMTRMLEWLRVEHPDAHVELENVAPALVTLFAEAMVGFLAAIREQFGSFEGYARALGVASAVPYLRAALVE